MTRKSGAINGRLSPLLRATANKLNERGIPDAEILRRGIRRVAVEEGISIEEVEKELKKAELKKTTIEGVPA
ncbi:MAG: hypothetical protein M0R03_14895 [Novosphingobium sp.]|nr:hypothetical protein [Novosphingobium sp.]